MGHVGGGNAFWGGTLHFVEECLLKGRVLDILLIAYHPKGH